MDEMIDEIKIAQCNLHKLERAQFQIIVSIQHFNLYCFKKKINASSFQKCFLCENQPAMNSAIAVLKICN